MRRIFVIAACLGLLAAAAPVAGQRGGPPGERQPGMRGPGGGGGMERALGLMLREREALELSEAQVNELESLQAQVREVTAPIREEQAQARDQWAAGELTREEMVELRRSWADRTRESLGPLHKRMEGILSAEQHETFRRLMWTSQRSAMRARRPGARDARRGAAALGDAYEAGFRAGLRAGRGDRWEGARLERRSYDRRRGAMPPDTTRPPPSREGDL